MARPNYSRILFDVLEQARLALEDEDRAPGRVVLAPGLMEAWDDCCDGQLYVRLPETFPSVTFPQFDTAQKGANLACAVKMLNLHIGLGVIRCAATLTDEGVAPTAEQVSADGMAMLDDMATLLEVITCKIPSIKGVEAVKVDRWTPKGVQGGCHGGEWGVHLAVYPCLPCS